MKNILIFLRHAETKIDKELPIEDWNLTEKGEQESKRVADIEEFQDVDIIISSTEKKAYLTVKPLADKLGKEILQIGGLKEIQRGNAGALSKEEYNDMKIKIFQDLDFTDYGWETSNNALNRFKKAIEEIDSKYENKKILISAHGTVITLYFAYLLNKLNDLMLRWKSLDFCDWGIIQNNKIIRDIV